MKKVILSAAALAAAALWAVNPITEEGKFMSDPAPRVGPDGKLWLFGSRDESARHYCSRFNDAFETTDLRSWKVHEGILDAHQVPNSRNILYAPDAIFHQGKWRLFFCTPGRYVEGVAEADSPTGPFTNLKAFDFAKQIDPSIFVDDDGSAYYVWGQFSMKGAKLKDDFSGVEPGSYHEGFVDEQRHNFHEGSQLLKRNGLYYLVYADIGRDHGTGKKRPTCIGYSTAKNVWGPYTYRGVIVDNFGCDPETWNNHGGIVEYRGKWYVCYHRTTNASVSMRKACIEEIHFDEQGLIKEVEPTSCGPAGALNPFAVTPARLACVMSGHVRIVTTKGKENLAAIHGGDTATWRYFDFAETPKELSVAVAAVAGGKLVVTTADGRKLSEGAVPAGDGVTVKNLRLPVTGKVECKRVAIKFEFLGERNANWGALDSFRFCR